MKKTKKIVKDREHFKRIGRLGGLKTRQRLKEDPNYFANIGLKGGRALMEARGKEWYSTIASRPRPGRRKEAHGE